MLNDLWMSSNCQNNDKWMTSAWQTDEKSMKIQWRCNLVSPALKSLIHSPCMIDCSHVPEVRSRQHSYQRLILRSRRSIETMPVSELCQFEIWSIWNQVDFPFQLDSSLWVSSAEGLASPGNHPLGTLSLNSASKIAFRLQEKCQTDCRYWQHRRYRSTRVQNQWFHGLLADVFPEDTEFPQYSLIARSSSI